MDTPHRTTRVPIGDELKKAWPYGSLRLQIGLLAGLGTLLLAQPAWAALDFSNSGQSLGNNDSNSVAMADLDGDGDKDAFVTNYGGQDAVYLNQGGDQGGSPGEFSRSVQVGGINSYDVALGDVNGDGHIDALVGNGGTTNEEIFINDGTGSFSENTLNADKAYAVALGDLDGDGDLDAFVGDYNGDHTVYFNQGGDQGGTEGQFQADNQTLSAGAVGDIALADVDGDNDLDVLAANGDNTGGADVLWTNDGSGSFTSDQSLGSRTGSGAALADLDGDGDTDAFVANYNDGNQVYINQGGDQGGTEGNLQVTSQSLGSAASNGLALGDPDGDGDTDALVVTSSAGVSNNGYTNDGTATFADAGQVLGNGDSKEVALADVDGDGDRDAFVANTGGTANTVWINGLTSPDSGSSGGGGGGGCALAPGSRFDPVMALLSLMAGFFLVRRRSLGQ